MMDQEQASFARRMLTPIVTEFKREVAQQRANGASDADIENMLERIERTNRLLWIPTCLRSAWNCLRKQQLPPNFANARVEDHHAEAKRGDHQTKRGRLPRVREPWCGCFLDRFSFVRWRGWVWPWGGSAFHSSRETRPNPRMVAWRSVLLPAMPTEG